MHSETERIKSRKRHRCLWCRQIIEKGETYDRESYVDGNLHGSNAFHVECSDAMDRAEWWYIDEWYNEHCMWTHGRGSTEVVD